MGSVRCVQHHNELKAQPNNTVVLKKMNSTYLSSHLLTAISFSFLFVQRRKKRHISHSLFFVLQTFSVCSLFSVVAASSAGCPPALYRSYDGSCTSVSDANFGRSNQAQFTYIDGLDAYHPPDDEDLPSAREISNVVCNQKASKLSKYGLSEFATFFGQFVDHDLVATLENKAVNFDIPVPLDDRTFKHLKQLPFLRSILVPVVLDNHPERPRRGRGSSRASFPYLSRRRGHGGRDNQNNNDRGSFVDDSPSLVFRPVNNNSAVLDLSQVYGSEPQRALLMRTWSGGLMRHSEGDLLGFNEFGVRNAPMPTTDFFLAGDHRANEHPVLCALHTIFLREHNRLANEVSAAFPLWDDEKIFQTARAINIAQAQRIVYEEFYPAHTGFKAPRYAGYKANVNPAPSISFTTAAFRVGHSMVNDNLRYQVSRTSPVVEVPLEKFFWAKGSVFKRFGAVDSFMRPIFHNRAQQIDVHIVSSLRNFLFKSVKGQTAVDLASNNIQRGRDHGLPPLNAVRRALHLPAYHAFHQITSDRSIQRRLQKAYKSVDDVELWVGLLAEDNYPAALGQTAIKIWEQDFYRLMHGDRFHYSLGIALLGDVENHVDSAHQVLKNKVTMREIILRNTNLRDDELPQNIWII